MEALTYLDTHVVAWLYAGRRAALARGAADLIQNSDELFISPAVVLELEYLHETKRITIGANTVVQALSAQLGLRVCERPFPMIVQASLEQRWTRDPFDRLIVGHAVIANAALVTKDRSIRRHYSKAVW